MDVPYVLKKQGMYYAHNGAGYVARALNAELYSEEYANRYAKNHEEVTAHPINEVLRDSDEVQEYIDRLESMRDYMKHIELNNNQ